MTTDYNFDHWLDLIDDEIINRDKTDQKKDRDLDKLERRKILLEELLEAGGEYVSDGEEDGETWEPFLPAEIKAWEKELKHINKKLKSKNYVRDVAEAN